MQKIIILTALLAIAGFTLSSCAVKPRSLKPPEGAESDAFPRTYPDTSTDPAPY